MRNHSITTTKTTSSSQKPQAKTIALAPSVQQLRLPIQVQDKPLMQNQAKFNDDYPLQVTQQINYDLKNNIKMEVKCMFPIIQLQNQSQQIQGIITLSAIELKEHAKQIRAGVDLICLVDVSTSMHGKKMEQTKATLTTLTNFLTSQDRLCIILFNEEAARLCPLIVMNAQNKIILQEQIKQIEADGGTSIGSGVELAFKTIKDRRMTNNVTSVFILSDGQDRNALQDVKQQLKQFQDYVFTIHTFGFGKHHDEELMSDLASLKGGSFYYIQNPRIMDQCFIEVLGGLMSVVADDIRINMICQSQMQGLQICNTYGDIWEECITGCNYKIKVPQFAAGWSRAYVFTLFVPAGNNLTDQQRVQKVLKVNAIMKNAQDKKDIRIEAECSLQFCTENEMIPITNIDEQVQIEYLRVKGAQSISDARKQCQNSQFLEAQQLLDNIISTIKSCPPNVLSASKQLCQELQQCKKVCNSANFQEYGQKYLQQSAMTNQRQAGLVQTVDINGYQSYMASQNNNCLQRTLVLTLQTQKHK